MAAVLDRLELLVEGMVDGFFGLVLRGRIQPLEIARRLTRHAEEDKIISLNRVYVPNRFLVGLHPVDMASLRAVAPELEAEFQRFVGEWVLERDYTVSGPIHVELRAEERINRSRVRVTAYMDDIGAEGGVDFNPLLPPDAVGMLEGVEGPDAGRDLPIFPRRLVVGRAKNCEIQLEDPGVSPRYVALVPGEGAWRVEELNGGPRPRINGVLNHDGVLRHGDMLTLNESVFRVHLKQQDRVV